MDQILVLDFGGQYCHLIARRVRDFGVYAEILPYDAELDKIKSMSPKAIILSGGPDSVYEPNSPQLNRDVFNYILEQRIPLLGICYGLHLIVHELGGIIEPNESKEYGRTLLEIVDKSTLFYSLRSEETVWMSHGDQIKKLPQDFQVIARTSTCPIAAYRNEDNTLFGVQFHPEVVHTPKGNVILENFIVRIAKCEKQWKLENWIQKTIKEIQDRVGQNNRVILGLSGGVDSSVAAVLLHEAIGDRLHCIFVNNGLLRKHEVEEVQKRFKEKLGFKNFHHVNAEEIFLKSLENVEDPEKKRKIIGHAFIEVFEKKALELEKQFPDITFLAQGTIYPDRVESAATSKAAAKIKSHHNLTLPETMKLELLEPLRDLYKDEVRRIGAKLGLDEDVLKRHPFPGPGLAVRCLGAINKEKLDTLREADYILIEEIKKAGKYDELWQVFCVYIPVKTVGIMGDFRTYENICSIRAVESLDAMTASFAKLDWELLDKIATRIINEVKGFNRVVYDISNKPPATIEYE